MERVLLKKVYNKSPVFNNIRVFGCLYFETKLNIFDKFFERSEKCVLIGGSSEKKGYKLFSLDDRVAFFSKDAKFYEYVFPFKLSSTCGDDASF